ncbi:MAG: bifunctional 4-hydroxy-2-oxoglutarate aldolase/2-dehydro-3-deoxy-phosphogluconate aldolase [Candidatus Coatesbacteria bacterium]|nr:bifunctional 4-hydroxy-2-oxoglutarate aldolase/2-dehydro-3-deoxy-phosphogluconate aldolase [Candidatus Coatesbacteria bacterium]
MMNNVFDEIGRTKLIAVVRVDDADTAVEAALAIAEGGITAIEIPATVDQFDRAIRRLSLHGGLAVGAATLFSESDASKAVEAGASFLVSPIFVDEVWDVSLDSDAQYLPGAATPGEIYSIMEGGFEPIKVFPAECLGGPKYIKSLLAILPDAKLIPTGGISSANAREYIDAGAFAVGVGGSLLPKGLLEARDFKAITHLAFGLRASISE